jgi:ferritin
MLSKKIEDILNAQVEKEGYSSNLYLSMASRAETKGYAGIADNWIQWFVAEQIEEEASAHQILDKLNLLDSKNLYVFDRDIMLLRDKED